MFNIDFRRLAYNLIPHFLRKPENLETLYSYVKPLKTLNTTFNTLRTAILYKLTWTGQTIYLEHFLNDQFDPIGRGIFITNTNIQPFKYLHNVIESALKVYIFNISEAEPPVYFFNNTEILQSIHFIVNVPVAVSFVLIDMNESVKTYAQAGKNWSVVTF